MNKNLLIAPALATLLSLSVAPAAFANDGVCSGNKIDVDAGPALDVVADAGQVITGYCVKAGSVKQGLGPEYVTGLSVSMVTITHSSGKDISHYSVTYGPAPVEPPTVEPPPVVVPPVEPPPVVVIPPVEPPPVVTPPVEPPPVEPIPELPEEPPVVVPIPVPQEPEVVVPPRTVPKPTKPPVKIVKPKPVKTVVPKPEVTVLEEEVLIVVPEETPKAEVYEYAAEDALPFTGVPVGKIALGGVLLLAVGAALTFGLRKRV